MTQTQRLSDPSSKKYKTERAQERHFEELQDLDHDEHEITFQHNPILPGYPHPLSKTEGGKEHHSGELQGLDHYKHKISYQHNPTLPGHPHIPLSKTDDVKD